MAYETQQNPFDLVPQQFTRRELKKAFAAAIDQKAERIKTISKFLFQAHGLEITPTSTDEEIDRLPSMIAALGGLITHTDEQFEKSLQGTKPELIEVMRSHSGKEKPDATTRAMIFDGALLWGEVFRYRYPEAHWELAREPRSSVHYGDPVLAGTEKYRYEFDPRMELTGFVGCILSNEPDTWTLSRIMRFRAFRLGLGPEPGPEDQRVW